MKQLTACVRINLKLYNSPVFSVPTPVVGEVDIRTAGLTPQVTSIDDVNLCSHTTSALSITLVFNKSDTPRVRGSIIGNSLCSVNKKYKK